MKPTDIIKEVSRYLLESHDWEYEGKYKNTTIKQVTFDVYDESCNIYLLQRFTDEGSEYVNFYLDSLPETSALKYLTKLF